jgi:cell division protein FtsX
MHDLDIRLERLAAEATRDAVPPEPEAIARRGRRRRRRQLAGSALLVAVVAAGLILPARLAGRPAGDTAVPAATQPPAVDVAGADTLGGYWFGKTDASVYLADGVTPEQRDAVRRRILALDVLDQLFYESRTAAAARLRELYKAKTKGLEWADPAVVPDSFRVRLDAPEHFEQLRRALCPKAPSKGQKHGPCMDGVDVLIQDKAILGPVLVPKPWRTVSDVSVFLPRGTTAAQREAVRSRLEAIDGVAEVTYETPEQAYRRLPEKLRRDGRDPAKVVPLFSPGSVPGAFHVTLDKPARTEAFHRALCGSRTTGTCAGGLVVLEHSRR